MPVPKHLKAEIMKAVNKEYADMHYSLKRRQHIRDAIIYHSLGYGKGGKK